MWEADFIRSTSLGGQTNRCYVTSAKNGVANSSHFLGLINPVARGNVDWWSLQSRGTFSIRNGSPLTESRFNLLKG